MEFHTADEMWLPVTGYEGLYEVSDHGRVRRIPRSQAYRETCRVLRPWLGTTGYLLVSLYRDGSARKHRVHRLVALAFMPDQAADGLEVCHGDGVRTNNTLTNLRWDTRSSNMRDMVTHGTQFNHFRNRTACANGHPFTESNTLNAKDGRRCRECRRLRVLAWRRRKKAAA